MTRQGTLPPSEEMTSPRVVNPGDEHLDRSLRPRALDEYQGQEAIKDYLKIFLTAAQQRGEVLEHVLLHGPPGLGKTTLAHILSREMQTQIRVTSGPAIERAGDLAAILTNMSEGDILFIDEAHRLNKVVEETLYPAMEDFCLDLVIGKGPSARTLRLELPRFTLVGATTRIALMSGPLRDRFGINFRLEYYNLEALKKILHRSAQILKVPYDDEAFAEIAKRSRGTPRVANRLLKRVRDYAQVKHGGQLTPEVVRRALDVLRIDSVGLDSQDLKYLLLLIKKFEGGPAGIETLAAALSEDAGTLEEVVEPFLLQLGLIKRTPRGRVATKTAYRHLGLKNDRIDDQEALL